VPSWIRVFKPGFIAAAHYDAEGILVTNKQSDADAVPLSRREVA
jgi:hypothetical protein